MRASMRLVSRGTMFAVENATTISPEPCAAYDPARPIPSATRLHDAAELVREQRSVGRERPR